ncbi:MAG: rRNA maturation RNase YbeY [Candidatus Saccharicenans sp.]|nr:MAG: rRNA maturation RNase YbeY [Candidatus Aminicenantes bacterium]HEK86667.1 rRNA maturation RNase YbeY [Candidatus Aminicenantes bacterium]
MVTIINQLKKKPAPTKKLKVMLEELERRYKLRGAELSLIFVGPKTIQNLNKKYRRRNKPTDVLSFGLKEKAPDGKFYLGDIVICPAIAQRQAREKGHSVEREIAILSIHGFLHLLGFEHFQGLEEEEAKIRPLFLKDFR